MIVDLPPSFMRLREVSSITGTGPATPSPILSAIPLGKSPSSTTPANLADMAFRVASTASPPGRITASAAIPRPAAAALNAAAWPFWSGFQSISRQLTGVPESNSSVFVSSHRQRAGTQSTGAARTKRSARIMFLLYALSGLPGGRRTKPVLPFQVAGCTCRLFRGFTP